MHRWNNPDIPHKGWLCVGMDDLGEFTEPGEEINYESCEMCGKENIRYVHIMEHKDYGQLRVGGVCAIRMENDYETPRRREDECKKRAARRANFLEKEWSCRDNGNYTLRYKGENITIMKSRFGPGYVVVFQGKTFSNINGRRLIDLAMAKRAAFDKFDELHLSGPLY